MNGVVADVGAGTATGQGSDTFARIENVVGTREPDTLTGDGGPNTIFGKGGADSLSGLGGDDVLNGGLGRTPATAVVRSPATRASLSRHRSDANRSRDWD